MQENEMIVAVFTVMSIAVTIISIAKAWAKRAEAMRSLPAGGAASDERLARIENAIEAIAIEVERISEGQRYVTKVMSGPRSLPAANDAAANEVQLAERAARDRAGAERVP